MADLVARGAPVEHAPDRARLFGEITAIAQPGDVVLVMGARDETLHTFAKAIATAL